MIPSKITEPQRLPLRRVLGRYRVLGTRAYRDHEPGVEFVAFLDPGPEGRAIRRGSIKLLERIEVTVGSVPHTLPSALAANIPHERNGRGEQRLSTLDRRVRV